MVRSLTDEERQVLIKKSGLTEEKLVQKIIEEDSKRMGTWG